MKVSGAYSEPLDRQIMERVNISSFKGPVLMNRRNEMGGIRVERTRYRRWGGDQKTKSKLVEDPPNSEKRGYNINLGRRSPWWSWRQAGEQLRQTTSATSLVAVLDEESKSKDEESKSVVVLCSFSTFVIVHVLGSVLEQDPVGLKVLAKMK